ncbi:MAG: hypothetical protein ABI925_03800 [Verrucomicrobiota bacterium]
MISDGAIESLFARELFCDARLRAGLIPRRKEAIIFARRYLGIAERDFVGL